MRNNNLDFMGREYTIKFCAMLGHENSKKSVPWIESHPEIYKNTI